MGQQGFRAQRAEERVDQLLQEGRSLEGMHKARMKRGQEQIESRDKEIRDRGIAYDDLKAEANRRIQLLEGKLFDGAGRHNRRLTTSSGSSTRR